nr:energy-coupled thiamine transporter ThiT [Alkalibacillus aidingensis]
MLVEIAIFATIAFLLDMIPGLQFKIWAQGGSVSFAMVPVFIIALRWGLRAGVLTGLIFGFLNMIFGGYIVHWFQAILDYIAAFALLGVAGIFAKSLRNAVKNNHKGKMVSYITVAVLIGVALRFASHFAAGIIFFRTAAPEGQSVWMYSLIYNSTYLIPGFILTAVIIILMVLSRPRLILRD